MTHLLPGITGANNIYMPQFKNPIKANIISYSCVNFPSSHVPKYHENGIDEYLLLLLIYSGYNPQLSPHSLQPGS